MEFKTDYIYIYLSTYLSIYIGIKAHVIKFSQILKKNKLRRPQHNTLLYFQPDLYREKLGRPYISVRNVHLRFHFKVLLPGNYSSLPVPPHPDGICFQSRRTPKSGHFFRQKFVFFVPIQNNYSKALQRRAQDTSTKTRRG